VLENIIADLAVAALLRLGRQIETAARAGRGSPSIEDAKASDLLKNVDFSSTPLRLGVSLPNEITDDDITVAMNSPESQALALEILTAVITKTLPPARKRLASRWEHLIAEINPAIRPITGSLFSLLVSYYEIATRNVEANHPNAYRRLLGESQNRRITHVLEAIYQQSEIGPKTLSRATVIDYLDIYRRQLRRATRHITPPDFDRRKTVPIEELYVRPIIMLENSRNDQSQVRAVEILAAELDRTVLLGDPGNGKSTAAQVLLYESSTDPSAPIPFLVVLRDFAGSGIEVSVVDYLNVRLANVYQCPPPAGLIEQLLECGQALIIFDGLDELLDTSQRRSVTDAVDLFCNRYPLNRVLVTSRRVGYWQAPMDERQFQVLTLSGFSDDQVEDYVRKWFAQEDISSSEADQWTAAFMDESSQVRDLTRTPLLLALMCIIYRGDGYLPRNRPSVYERCAITLFDKWDHSRGIHADLRVGQLVDSAVKHLAYWLFVTDTGDGVTETDLVREATSYLHRRSFELEEDARAAALEFVEFCRGRAWVFSDVGTTADGESLYKFTHRTFLEYFAAHYVVKTSDTPELLAATLGPKVSNAEWDVVAQLALQICDKNHEDGADRAIANLLKQPISPDVQSHAHLLSFIARCLSFVQVSPAIVRRLTRESLAQLNGDSVSAHAPDALMAIIANSGAVEFEYVKAEIEAFILGSISGTNDSARRFALSFISSGDMYAGAKVESHAFVEGLQQAGRAPLVDHHGEDVEYAHACLRRGWIDLPTFIASGGGGLDWILKDVSIQCLQGRGFLPYGVELIATATGNSPEWTSIIGGRQTRDAQLTQLDQIADISSGRIREGLYLAAGASDMFDFFYDDSASIMPSHGALSSHQLLGAGFLIACFLENDLTVHGVAARRDWGALQELVEWLGSREDVLDHAARPSCFNESSGAETLETWVRGERNFLSPRSS
jgi:hypothetical protein